MKTVNKLDLIYRKLVVKAQEQYNETVEISDEEYAKYYEVEPEPIEPTPDSDIPIPGEEDPNHDYSQDYLTFEALEDGTFSFTINDLYYSTNNSASWKSLAAGTETELITAGTKVLWRIDSSYNVNNTSIGMGTFSSTGKFNVSGNVLSLINYTDFRTKYNLNDNNQFIYLFKNCINLLSAHNLILQATSLRDSCYSNMFRGCSSLIYGPQVLPAINFSTNTDGCYQYMFADCINLIESPILLGDISNGGIYSNYYNGMFYGCSSLQKITMLSKGVYIGNLKEWVKDVPPGGIFIKNSKSTFDNIGDSGIPAGWEVINEEVPEE